MQRKNISKENEMKRRREKRKKKTEIGGEEKLKN